MQIVVHSDLLSLLILDLWYFSNSAFSGQSNELFYEMLMFSFDLQFPCGIHGLSH